MTLGLERLIATFLAVAVRIGMLMIFAPFFGSQAVPARVKAGLTLVLTVLVLPISAAPPAAPDGLSWALSLFGEVIAGLALALTTSLVFEGAQFAGQVLGIQLGYSLVNVLDPQTAVDTPILSTFHQLIVLMIFLQLNVHHWLLRALVKSFELVPVGSVRVSFGAMQQLVRAAGSLFVIGIQIAAPILTATLLIDVALGLIGRVAPQVPVLFIGISVKSVLGLAILAGSVALWPKLFERYFLNAMHASEGLLHLIR